MTPNSFEIEILLKIKAQTEELLKTKKALADVGDEAKSSTQQSINTNKSLGDSFETMQRGLRSTIEPITMLRRTIWQVGLMWTLTAGTVIAAIKDIEAKIKNLNDISVNTGKSVEELSHEMYGFNIATKESTYAASGLIDMQRMLSNGWTAVTSTVSNYIGSMRLASREESIYVDLLQKRRDDLTKSKGWFAGTFGAGPSDAEDKNIRIEAHYTAMKQLEDERKANFAKSKEGFQFQVDFANATKQLTLSTFSFKRDLLDKEGELLKRNGAKEIESYYYIALKKKVLFEEERKIFEEIQSEHLTLTGQERESFLLLANQKIRSYENLIAKGKEVTEQERNSLELAKQNLDLQIKAYDFRNRSLNIKLGTGEPLTKGTPQEISQFQGLNEFKTKLLEINNDIDKGNLSTYEYRKKILEQSLSDEKSYLERGYITDKQFQNLRKSTFIELEREKLSVNRSVLSEMTKLEGNYTNYYKLQKEEQMDIARKAGMSDLEQQEKLIDLKRQLEEDQRLGLKQNYEIMEDMNREFVNSIRSSFKSVFSDSFRGELKSAKDYFRAFTEALQNMWAEALAQMVTNTIFSQNSINANTGGGKSSGLGGILNIFSTLSSLFGGGQGFAQLGGTGFGSGNVPIAPPNYYLGAHAEGGWAGLKGPEISLLGEKEPEMIIPLSKLSAFKQESSISKYIAESMRSHQQTDDKSDNISYIKSRANGGWSGLKGPEINLVGENEPELITPASKIKAQESEASVTNIHYYIQAVDAQSFAELVSRNPDAIVAVTSRAIERNKGLRRTIKEFA